MTALYLDIEPYVCAWTENLMDAGLIPPGEIWCRSIKDIQPRELRNFTQVHAFNGFSGWAHALRKAGWPDDRPCWTGSAPCTPFSVAGKQEGFEDPRHLWPDFARLIRKCRPPTVFGEQVASASSWLNLVRGDLEKMGYAVGCVPIQAASAGADHFRDRYFFVANHSSEQWGRGDRGVGGLRIPNSLEVEETFPRLCLQNNENRRKIRECLHASGDCPGDEGRRSGPLGPQQAKQSAGQSTNRAPLGEPAQSGQRVWGETPQKWARLDGDHIHKPQVYEPGNLFYRDRSCISETDSGGEIWGVDPTDIDITEHHPDRNVANAARGGAQPVQQPGQICCTQQASAGGRDSPLAHRDRERSQVPLSISGNLRPECAPAQGDPVRGVEYDQSVGWGKGWTQSEFRSRGFTATVASIEGSQYIECPDGKWRRLPPPTVLWLASRLRARIPQVRALGNSIDVRPATAFIKAFMESQNA